MKRAAAIVTNRGGRTCHAAIIARELGIPAVVGCGDATDALKDGDAGDGVLRRGRHRLHLRRPAGDRGRPRCSAARCPTIPVKIMMNVGNPQLAFDFAQLPNDGVGLARLEFIINNNIGVHPKAMPRLPERRRRPEEGGGVGGARPRRRRARFYVDKLAEGVATIAAAFWPKPVIVRLSDFKSNEYRKLIGGARYEPEEENPMLGFRGASRYIARVVPRCFRARVRGDAQGARRPWA